MHLPPGPIGAALTRAEDGPTRLLLDRARELLDSGERTGVYVAGVVDLVAAVLDVPASERDQVAAWLTPDPYL